MLLLLCKLAKLSLKKSNIYCTTIIIYLHIYYINSTLRLIIRHIFVSLVDKINFIIFLCISFFTNKNDHLLKCVFSSSVSWMIFLYTLLIFVSVSAFYGVLYSYFTTFSCKCTNSLLLYILTWLWYWIFLILTELNELPIFKVYFLYLVLLLTFKFVFIYINLNLSLVLTKYLPMSCLYPG